MSLHTGQEIMKSGSTRIFEGKVLLRLEEADMPLRIYCIYLTVIGKLGGVLSLCQRKMRKCERNEPLLTTVFTKQNISGLKRSKRAIRERLVSES
jgi:hypothetical protein